MTTNAQSQRKRTVMTVTEKTNIVAESQNKATQRHNNHRKGIFKNNHFGRFKKIILRLLEYSERAHSKA